MQQTKCYVACSRLITPASSVNSAEVPLNHTGVPSNCPSMKQWQDEMKQLDSPILVQDTHTLNTNIWILFPLTMFWWFIVLCINLDFLGCCFLFCFLGGAVKYLIKNWPAISSQKLLTEGNAERMILWIFQRCTTWIVDMSNSNY